MKKFVNLTYIKKRIDTMFNDLPDVVYLNMPLSIGWTRRNVGFGETCFYVDEYDKQLKCDNERMPKEFIKQVLLDLIEYLDTAELQDTAV